jgi:excisionase family DNA binding protein
MAMNNKIEFVLSLPINELAEAIIQKLNTVKGESISDNSTHENFLTRQEVSKKLNITLPTLHNYTKRGLIKSYKIGSRILYKESDIDRAITEIKFRHF